MSEQQKAIQTRFAERLRDFKAEFAPKVAKLNRPVLGNVPVSKDERRRRWWQQEDGWTPEHELMLLTALNPDGSPIIDANGRPKQPLSREDVGLLKHPYREVDAMAFGAGDERKVAAYAREMSDLGPPDPEPLELAAMQAQAPQQGMRAANATNNVTINSSEIIDLGQPPEGSL
jgi:hypothetical protein